ncbi:MAG: F0F1 ATP synthase subunit B' [Acidobacteriia bacterium]|nr:F0F1 ATP synthase subunit B' [Methyloceanibacter sp.]MCL6492530.1 F0F1 ATP synthase subunit B' [Terriglobia bacterium]
MRKLLWAAPVFWVLSPASPALAEGGEGMPQIAFGNPLTTSQVVWLAVIFAVFYVVLARGALPRVAEVLAERAKIIKNDLEAAQAAKAEADKAVAEVEVAIRRAHAEAQARVAEAVAQAKAAAEAEIRALNARLEQELKSAEERIAAARRAAMAALRDVAVEVANEMVARLTGLSPVRPALEQAVVSALAKRET